MAAYAGNVWLHERDWREHPDIAFQAITGRSLPGGVCAAGYINAWDDFHSTSYWMLTGTHQKLLAVPEGHGLIQAGCFTADEAERFERKFGIVDSRAKVTGHFYSADDGTQDHLPMSLYYVLDNGTAFFVR